MITRRRSSFSTIPAKAAIMPYVTNVESSTPQLGAAQSFSVITRENNTTQPDRATVHAWIDGSSGTRSHNGSVRSTCLWMNVHSQLNTDPRYVPPSYELRTM